MKKQYATKKSANFVNSSQGAPLVNINHDVPESDQDMEELEKEKIEEDEPQIISITKIENKNDENNKN